MNQESSEYECKYTKNTTVPCSTNNVQVHPSEQQTLCKTRVLFIALPTITLRPEYKGSEQERKGKTKTRLIQNWSSKQVKKNRRQSPSSKRITQNTSHFDRPRIARHPTMREA